MVKVRIMNEKTIQIRRRLREDVEDIKMDFKEITPGEFHNDEVGSGWEDWSRGIFAVKDFDGCVYYWHVFVFGRDYTFHKKPEARQFLKAVYRSIICAERSGNHWAKETTHCEKCRRPLSGGKCPEHWKP